MLHDMTIALPVKVRPAPFESLESLEARLRDANHYTKRAWNTFVNPSLRADPSLTRVELVTSLGGLRPGHFDGTGAVLAHANGETCDRCVTGITVRFACTRCTRSATAKEVVHDGPRVCRKHMRWVGPGTDPADQYTVGVDVLRADRAYQRLRRSGRADAHRLAEVLACVDAWTDANNEPLDAGRRFVVAVALLREFTAPATVTGEALPEDGYAALASIISSVAADENLNVLVDGLWLLLGSARHAEEDAPHVLRPALAVSGGGDGLATAVLSSSFYPRVRHLQLTQLAGSPAAGTRFELAVRLSDQNTYVCPNGHRYESQGQVLRASKASGGCGYCARKKATPETSLAASHPEIAAEWHPTLNGDVTPAGVLSGTGDEYAWLCAAQGHTYYTTPNSRTSKGSGCGYCANVLVDESNCLRTTHTQLAAEWNTEKNGDVTPDNVVAGSEERVWWICEEGHEFHTTVAARTRGAGCHVCTHQLAHPTTCLAATHPEIAAKWDYERNGDVTPETVFAGSLQKVSWRCDNGCSYDAAIVSKVKGIGCRYCSNRGVNEKNCMRATNPALAAQLHPTKNGKRTADNIVAGTSHYLWWLCPEGHDWKATGDNRLRQDAGCPYCGNRKVWAGLNDMASVRPDLAAEFDVTKNGNFTPETIVFDTWRPLWWKCANGHEWRATGESRATKGRGCRKCPE